jgi:hypothetical protein
VEIKIYWTVRRIRLHHHRNLISFSAVKKTLTKFGISLRQIVLSFLKPQTTSTHINKTLKIKDSCQMSILISITKDSNSKISLEIWWIWEVEECLKIQWAIRITWWTMECSSNLLSSTTLNPHLSSRMWDNLTWTVDSVVWIIKWDMEVLLLEIQCKIVEIILMLSTFWISDSYEFNLLTIF